MFADSYEPISTGILYGPEIERETDRSILTVVSFVDDQLTVFSQRYTNSAIRHEKGLTNQLCILLLEVSKTRNFPFNFVKDPLEEPSSGHSPSPDIGTFGPGGIIIDTKAYANDESFFSLEAKILGVKETHREKEYVIGEKRNGGIERFKKGIHGKNLAYAGMLGYVLKHNFTYWYNAINSWIDERIDLDSPFWNTQDKLIEKRRGEITAQYESDSLRRDTRHIRLFHLWVML